MKERKGTKREKEERVRERMDDIMLRASDIRKKRRSECCDLYGFLNRTFYF